MSQRQELTLPSLGIAPPPLELNQKAVDKSLKRKIEKIEKEYEQKLLKAKQLLVQEMKDRNGHCSICRAKSGGSIVFHVNTSKYFRNTSKYFGNTIPILDKCRLGSIVRVKVVRGPLCLKSLRRNP